MSKLGKFGDFFKKLKIPEWTFGMGIRGKMIFLSVVLASCLVVVGWVGFRSLTQVLTHYERITQIILPTTEILGSLTNSARELSRIAIQMGLSNNSEEVVAKLLDEVSEFKTKFEVALKKYAEVQEKISQSSSSEVIRSKWDALLPLIDTVVKLSTSKDKNDKIKYQKVLSTEFQSAKDELFYMIQQRSEFQSDLASQWMAEGDQTTKKSNQMTRMVILGGLIFSITVGYLISAGLSRQLNKVVEQVVRGAGELTSASKVIAQSSEELLGAALKQVSSLEHTNVLMNEMNERVKSNAENSEKSKQASDVSHGVANTGKETVEEMITATKNIDDAVRRIMEQIQDTNNEMLEIFRLLEGIEQKTQVINEIAMQTKLLSFNASIEAARAGAAGTGFGVVAGEVKSLSDMSKSAAAHISEHLGNSLKRAGDITRTSTEKISGLVATTRESVEQGRQVAERCRQVLEEIVSNARDVNDRVGKITMASSEQTERIREVNIAIDELNQITQRNEGSARQASALAEQLNTTAENFRNVAFMLLLTVKGRKVKNLQMGGTDVGGTAGGGGSTLESGGGGFDFLARAGKHHPGTDRSRRSMKKTA